MKILIPTLSAATRPDGVSRHAVNLVRCLLQLTEVEQVDLVLGDWQRAYLEALLPTSDPRLQLHIEPTSFGSIGRNFWYARRLPRLAASLQSDLVHLSFPVPLRRASFACPVVVTLHDLYPYDVPENFGYPRVFLNRFILDHCLAAVDAIACVSDTTLHRLQARYPAHLQKSSRVYNALSTPNAIDPAPAPPLPLLATRPFLLAVAQHRRNKNLPLTLGVYRRLLRRYPDLLLLLVGNEGPETAQLRAALDTHGLRSRVLFLRGLTDQQLQWCYLHAEALLATSTFEGFGLPVAEAMLAGCPVVCSDIPAFREIGAPTCRLVPLTAHAEQAFSEAVTDALAAPRPAPLIPAQFSLPVLSKHYLRLYRGLLAPQLSYTSSPLALKSRKDELA